MADEGVDWTGVSEDMARQILQQGETFMQAQLQAAIASDSRATAMCGLYLTLALAILAAGLGYWQQVDIDAVLFASLTGGGALIAASAFAAWAARPVDFFFPGNQPHQWIPNRTQGLLGMLGGEAENYDARIAFNEAQIASSKRAVDRALKIAVLSPLAALIVWGASTFWC